MDTSDLTTSLNQTLIDGGDDLYYKVEGVLAMFYAIRPSRTMWKDVNDTPNFYNIFAQIFPFVFLIEYIVVKLTNLPSHNFVDALIGFCSMNLAAVPQALFEVTMFGAYAWIWTNYRIIDLPYDSMIVWFLCILAIDFSVYVAHRLSHEVNILWALHQVHHTSEYQNLFTPARNSFLTKFVLATHDLPWAFLLPPGPAKVHHQLSVIFQFWIHTPLFRRPSILDYVVVTPIQHVIHHGRNRFCIDKNYGGVLSIWDQMFGTMEWPHDHVNETVYFGLVHTVKTWDLWYIYTHSLKSIYHQMCKFDGVENKLAVLWNGPAWEPGKPRLGVLEEIPETPEDTEPYNKTSSYHIYIYCILNIIVAFVFNNRLVGLQLILPWQTRLIGWLFVAWTVIDVGYVLEHKWFVTVFEWTRGAMFFVVYALIGDIFIALPPAVVTAVKLWSAITCLIWTFNLGYFSLDTNKKVD